MPRLVRPNIPLSVRLTVALRQCGLSHKEVDHEVKDGVDLRKLGDFLAIALGNLAVGFGCPVDQLRLDHDPPLGARKKVFSCNIHVGYEPSANDPAYLFYRPHAPEFAGSHLVKTNIRGDGAQHPDRVLIKKNRALERREQGIKRRRPAAKIKGLSFQQQRCKLGARCRCGGRDRKRCNNYRKGRP